jgi:gas vesicle protein
METKDILIGVVIGALIGAVGIYLVNMPRVSQMNTQVKALQDQVKQLEDAVSAQQVLIDSQEARIIMVDALEEELNATRDLAEEYQEYALTLTLEYELLNKMCAQQTYKLEEALTKLNQSEIEFSFVYGDLSFEDWWEINKSPLEQWWRIVYG